jgi:hypothetical protein
VSPQRRTRLAEALAVVRARIDAACRDAGRDPAGLTLVVVTKTHPADDIRLLAGLGVADVGENRDQEAGAKAAELADLDLRWHFVGQLQTNKARSVVRYAHLVHSVDRPQLADSLGRAAAAAGRQLPCLVQVSLDEEPGRGGCPPAGVPALADRIAGTEGLRLDGVMAVAPLGADPRPAFERLAGVAQRLRAAHPGAAVVSAGMSGDLEHAVACGATHLRVGSAVLGQRPPRR